MTGTRDPADAFSALNKVLLSEVSLDDVLDHVAREAKAVLGEGFEVSVTVLRARRAATVASTGQLARDVDETQYDNATGPCLDAAATGELIRVDDVEQEHRWPSYAAAATDAGVRSSVSVPLPMPERVHAALNVYSTRAHAFDDDDIAVLEAFAAQAAVAVANAELYRTATTTAAQLEQAMQSRAVIEQAKGVVMALQRCSSERAFEILVEESQRSNRKLREVAQEVVDRTTGGGG